MSTDAPPPRFDQTAFAILEAAARDAGRAVPEVEGIAFVVLWRLPDQSNIPSCQLVGARGPLSTPDQLARMALATTRLQHWLADRYGESLVGLRTLESQLTRLIHERKADLAALRTEGHQGGTIPPAAGTDLAVPQHEVAPANESR